MFPTFVRRYAEQKPAGVDALAAFAADVADGALPEADRELPLKTDKAAPEDRQGGGAGRRPRNRWTGITDLVASIYG